MPKPTKPTPPAKALRSDPSTFPARAEGTVDFLFDDNLDYVADSNTFIDERADAALAAALGGDLPAITGQSLKLLRVNAGETAAEFTSAADVTAAIKASTANAEAGTGTGLMDPVLTKAAIDASRERGGAIVATTSGTAFDFTGIPAEVQEIEVLFDGVSLIGTDNLLVQIGTSGGIVATGYVSSSGINFGSNASAKATSTSGFVVYETDDGGCMSLKRMASGSNVWIAAHSGSGRVGSNPVHGGGRIDLAAELTQVRITRTGTNTFDAGQLNVRWK